MHSMALCILWSVIITVTGSSCFKYMPITVGYHSVSARPEFCGVINDPLFENLGVIGKFRGSELFYV